MSAIPRPRTALLPTIPPAAPSPGGPRILLCSVFGPYAQDDEFGSRKINPMELYHNQVTRLQGPFSLRMFHRSWGLMLIQANLKTPCMLLDFPTRERFVRELQTNAYDIVGISAIPPNIGKVREMCRLIRDHLPHATIVVGGHIGNVDGLSERIDADHIVKGEGVKWFRDFLGEPHTYPLNHPQIISGFNSRMLGVNLSRNRKHGAATVLPSVGCPMGCNFCSTSAMFGGKGHVVNFYETGDELFEIMQGLEKALGVQAFFVMDENFLLHRKRALRLLELMETHGKAWSMYVFSSANVLRKYTIDQLVALGVSWVWMGLEGENSSYAKLKNADTKSLVRELQSNGIRVLGSTIIGLETHTPENLPAAIDYAVEHRTDFHQFMLYTPIPGTPLHAEHRAKNTLLSAELIDDADVHGQLRFNFRHPNFADGEETAFLHAAFETDFQHNGPSLIRMIETTLDGWLRYKNHPNPRIRARYHREATGLATSYAGALWAAQGWFKKQGNMRVVEIIRNLRNRLQAEFGWLFRVMGPLVGSYVRWAMRREYERMQAGWTLEPPTFYEANDAAFAALPAASKLAITRAHCVAVPDPAAV